MTTAEVAIAVVFGSVGFAYFLYGRRQHAPMAWIAGLGLVALPYLCDSTAGTLIAGALLLALPFFVEL